MKEDKEFRHRRLIESLPKKRRVTIDEMPMPKFPLVTEMEEAFLQHWSASYTNAGQCARNAGYPAVTSGVTAHQLLSKWHIKARLSEIERERMEIARINAEGLFREVVTQNLRLARAKVPVDVVTPPCRYCHGDNHEYQRTHAEFEDDLERHLTRPRITRTDRFGRQYHRTPIFDPKGGSGYDINLPPHPDCPNCHGEGDINNQIVKIKDSRFFTAEERELWNGAKLTEKGVETFWKDQSKARSFLSDLALRMVDHRRPEDAIDITEMSPDRLRQFLIAARDQGFDVDPEILEDAAE
jgi:hypothetical protein